jgi:hypothetical protein
LIVEQNGLILLCVLDADLWLCPNGTFHYKLHQNDPFGSNLRKKSPKMRMLLVVGAGGGTSQASRDVNDSATHTSSREAVPVMAVDLYRR